MIIDEDTVETAGESMTKAALVEEVARVADLTKKHAEIIVDTVFRSIIDALHRGEKIELRGFGSFRLRRREPRKGRNPKTGDRVDVPSKRVPYFKPGKELKELINRDAESVEPTPVSTTSELALPRPGFPHYASVPSFSRPARRMRGSRLPARSLSSVSLRSAPAVGSVEVGLRDVVVQRRIWISERPLYLLRRA